MEKVFLNVVAFVAIVVFAGVFGLLLAFPLKWCWNYVMPYLFEFKVITWGHAWCLSFLSGLLVQSSYSHNSNK